MNAGEGCPASAAWRTSLGVAANLRLKTREKCAASVTGKALDCGHFLQEERPQDLLAELRFFLS